MAINTTKMNDSLKRLVEAERKRRKMQAAAPDLLDACIAAAQSNMIGSDEASVTISKDAWEKIQKAIYKATT